MLIPTLLKKEINTWFKRRSYSTASNARRAANHVASKALSDLPVVFNYSVNKMDSGSYQVEFNFN